MAHNGREIEPAAQQCGQPAIVDQIIVFGLNHDTAPIEIREKFALALEARRNLISRLRACAAIEEAAVLNTCNRVEFIISFNPSGSRPKDPPPVEDNIRNLPLGMSCAVPHRFSGIEYSIYLFLEEISGMQRDLFGSFIYIHQGKKAVEHLLRVAAGLDSMVKGESEILGQMRSAYEEARLIQATGPVLNPLFQQIFRAAKEVRTRSAIGRNVSSVVSLTRRIARRTFADIEKKRLLIVGAGETAKLALKHFHTAGIGEIMVLNRTVKRAAELAQSYGAEFGGLDQLNNALAEADIVVTALTLPAQHGPLVRAELLQQSQTASRPLLLLDLGVPRNIDEDIRRLPGIVLFNIGDLELEAEKSADSQILEIKRAEQVIRSEAAEIENRLERRAINNTIDEVRRTIGSRRSKQVERALAELRRSGLSAEQCQAASPVLERLFDRAAAEALHNPLTALQEAGGDDAVISSFRRFFVR